MTKEKLSALLQQKRAQLQTAANFLNEQKNQSATLFKAKIKRISINKSFTADIRKLLSNTATFLQRNASSLLGTVKRRPAGIYRAFMSLDKPVRLSCVAGFVLLCLFYAGIAAITHVRSYTYVVYIDGEEIGYVTEKAVADEALIRLRSAAAEKYGMDVGTEREISVQREQRRGIIADDQGIEAKIAAAMDFKVYGYMIIVNGKSTLAVRSIEDYKLVIEQLKSAYLSGKKNALPQAVVLHDRVEARLQLIEPDSLHEADHVAGILLRGTDRQETYLVSRGDSLWTIARNNNMTVSQIRAANPQLGESDRLVPGDEIDLVVAEPLVTVSVTEEVVETEDIPYRTINRNDSRLYRGASRVIRTGRNGERQVTYLITRVNGRETEREILDEVVISEPSDRIVAQGTKALAPGAGTGRFIWPVAGGGRISSPFGPRRGGYHRGVDIASARGTPVLAADSGTVVQSGWQGSFGILVTISHGNGYFTKYAHNSKAHVRLGQQVEKGQQIASVGSTGNSTGPHLHFEVIRNGVHVNPLNYF